jgi:Zn-dependent protease with chaperone function
MAHYQIPKNAPPDLRARIERLARAVEASEAHLARDPEGFQRTAVRISKIAYFALPGFAVFLLAVIGGLYATAFTHPGFLSHRALGMISLFCAVTIYTVIRSMPMKVEAPDGIALTPEQAPALFAAVEDVRQRLNAPFIHAIYLTNDFNAAMSQRPTRGIFGGFRNELIAGLPMMQALTAAEFKGVIGHELGHLVGDHSKSWMWSCRAFKVWHTFQERTDENRSVTDIPLRLLMRLFAHHVYAVNYVLARHTEFIADAAEATVAGHPCAGRTLSRMAIASAYSSEFWSHFMDEARLYDKPLAGPFATLDRIFGTAATWDGAKHALNRALAEKTGLLDTHPALAERLAALGQKGTIPPPVDVPASSLLGTMRATAIAQFDTQWWDEAHEAWTEHRQNLQQSEARIASLIWRPDHMSFDQELTAAKLAVHAQGVTQGLPRLRDIARRFPGEPRAHFVLAQALAETRDINAAIDHAERAIGLDPSAAMAAAELVSDLMIAAGDTARATMFQDHAESDPATGAHTKAAEADQWLARGDCLLPHLLLPAELEAARAAIAPFGWLHAAFFVRKPVREWLDQNSLHLVLVPAAQGMADTRLDRMADPIDDAIDKALGGMPFTISIARKDWLWIAGLATHPEAAMVFGTAAVTGMAKAA